MLCNPPFIFMLMYAPNSSWNDPLIFPSIGKNEKKIKLIVNNYDNFSLKLRSWEVEYNSGWIRRSSTGWRGCCQCCKRLSTASGRIAGKQKLKLQRWQCWWLVVCEVNWGNSGLLLTWGGSFWPLLVSQHVPSLRNSPLVGSSDLKWCLQEGKKTLECWMCSILWG